MPDRAGARESLTELLHTGSLRAQQQWLTDNKLPLQPSRDCTYYTSSATSAGRLLPLAATAASRRRKVLMPSSPMLDPNPETPPAAKHPNTHQRWATQGPLGICCAGRQATSSLVGMPWDSRPTGRSSSRGARCPPLLGSFIGRMAKLGAEKLETSPSEAYTMPSQIHRHYSTKLTGASGGGGAKRPIGHITAESHDPMIYPEKRPMNHQSNSSLGEPGI